MSKTYKVDVWFPPFGDLPEGAEIVLVKSSVNLSVATMRNELTLRKTTNGYSLKLPRRPVAIPQALRLTAFT